MRRHIHRFEVVMHWLKKLYFADMHVTISLTLFLLHQVNQTYMVSPLDQHFSILYDVLKKHVAEDVEYKVCFLTKYEVYNLNVFSLSWTI